MKQTINLYQFRDAFQRMDRGDQFSYEGLEVLFNGLEEFEQDTNEEMELDVIELCCDYCEMTEQEIKDAYCVNIEDTKYGNIEDWLSNQTWILGETESKTLVFRQF